MNEKTVMDALVQMKRTGNLLNELWDMTQQLGQSIDRNDQVSTQMIINMREDPGPILQEQVKYDMIWLCTWFGQYPQRCAAVPGGG